MEKGSAGVLAEVGSLTVRALLDAYLLLGGCVLAFAAVDEACGWLCRFLGDDE